MVNHRLKQSSKTPGHMFMCLYLHGTGAFTLKKCFSIKALNRGHAGDVGSLLVVPNIRLGWDSTSGVMGKLKTLLWPQWRKMFPCFLSPSSVVYMLFCDYSREFASFLVRDMQTVIWSKAHKTYKDNLTVQTSVYLSTSELVHQQEPSNLETV